MSNSRFRAPGSDSFRDRGTHIRSPRVGTTSISTEKRRQPWRKSKRFPSQRPRKGMDRSRRWKSPRASGGAPMRSIDSPFAFIRWFAEEMDQFFEDYGFGFGLRMPSLLICGHELLPREAGLVSAEWSPRVDILQREDQFMVRADLPGLTKDDIKAEVTERLITLQGERKQEQKTGARGLHLLRVQPRSLLPRHPGARGCRCLEGHRGVPQRRARDRDARPGSGGEQSSPPGDPRG